MEPASRSKPGPRRRWMRGLVFRLGAVVLGLVPFVAAEAAFTLLDWGRPTYRDDPFVGFNAVHPLFVLNEDQTRYEIAPSRSEDSYFRPDFFAKEKPPSEFRIFCLGGSTVQGRPFAIETSFTTWLELNLQAADPQRAWEVVNCGGVSYASYRLVPILEEVVQYEPDLIIVYTGHNEFLEDRTYAHIKRIPWIVARPCELVLRTRTYTVLREAYAGFREHSEDGDADGRPVLEDEVDAMLEYRGGLEQYHRDDKWRRDVIEHFRFNLRRMVDIAQDAGVPLLLVNPVSNLRDCPPFKAQHRDGLTPEERKRWEALVDEAAEHYDTNVYQAATILEKALTIDDQHAGLQYLVAKCYDASGMLVRARQAYLAAKELDVCPLRILEPMNQAVLDVAHQTNTPLVDVRKLFEDLTDAGIPGGYGLLDHVHPSISGHKLIAGALADEMVRQGFVRPSPDWAENRERRYGEHEASLNDFYFAKGQERLERLRLWTQGKADRVRPASGSPQRPDRATDGRNRSADNRHARGSP